MSQYTSAAPTGFQHDPRSNEALRIRELEMQLAEARLEISQARYPNQQAATISNQSPQSVEASWREIPPQMNGNAATPLYFDHEKAIPPNIYEERMMSHLPTPASSPHLSSRSPQPQVSRERAFPPSNCGHPPQPSSSSHPSSGPPPRYTANSTCTELPLPVVVPQTTKAFGGAFASPFCRAYVPELQLHGISQSDFLTFIDGLNESWIGHPAFQGLSLVGAGMGMAYGVHPVQWAGMGLQFASNLGSAATSFARTKVYIKEVNNALFHPAGLQVTILSTKDMMAKVGSSEERLQLPPLEETSQLSKKEVKRDIREDRLQITEDDPRMRRIRALEGYVMPLDFNVPDATSPDSFLKKMSHAAAQKKEKKGLKKQYKERAKDAKEKRKKYGEADEKRSEGQRELEKIQDKIMNERAKMERKLGGRKFQEDSKERQKVIREFEKEEAKLQKEYEKEAAKVEKEVGKHSREAGKSDVKEEKAANKIRWIVVCKLDGEGEEDSTEDSASMRE